MNTNKLFPFMGDYTSDLNTSLSEWAVCNSKTLNMPEIDDTGNIAICLTTSYVNGIYISQLCLFFSGKVYARSTYNGANGEWKHWRRLDNFGYNTLDELAAALKPKLGL